jgi:fructosamine-3-kinase
VNERGSLSLGIEDRIEAALGVRPRALAPLSGGCIAEAYRTELPGGERVAVKCAAGAGNLELEAYMLRYLAEHSRLPVPAVLYADADILIMAFIETAGGLDASAERHAAELLAELHGITAPAFGHERDTLIGPLHQPNPWTERWVDFFRDQRLLYMARLAFEAGRLPQTTLRRLEHLAEILDRYIENRNPPGLIHGDMWGGNVLARNGRIAGFIDPAIYHADPEIELAFSTLFSTYGSSFFDYYNELRPLSDGFFEVRRDLYNLYPLLVHVRLFGGGYLGGVETTLKRLGC